MIKDEGREVNSPLKFLVCGVYLIIILYITVSYFLNVDGIRDAWDDVIGRDYINFWAGGRAVFESNVELLYDRSLYRELLLDNFGAPLNNYAFSYPPHALLIFTPFGALPYVWGLLLWTLGGLGIAYAACRQWLKKPVGVFWVVLGPAAIITLLGGQTGLFLVGLWGLSLALIDRRPVIAGILIGVMTIKPQIGVLLALYLLCGGYWKVIITASLTSLFMILASILLFGVQPWLAFIHDTLPFQSEIISREFGIFDHMVHTPFKWVINFGGGINLAWAVQIPFMMFGVAAIIWASFKAPDKRLLVCLLSALTFLFSPYMAIYDMTIIALAVCLYLQYRKDSRPADNKEINLPLLLLAALIATPVLGVLASILNIPLSVTLMSGFVGLLVRDIHVSTRSKPSAVLA